MSDITLNESIAMFEVSRSVKPWDHLKDEVVAPIVAAARLIADNRVIIPPCPTCDGEGHTLEPSATGMGQFEQLCDWRLGSGHHSDTIERIAQTVADEYGWEMEPDLYGLAITVLVALTGDSE